MLFPARRGIRKSIVCRLSFLVPRASAAETSGRDFVAVVNHMSAKKEQRFFVLGIQHELGLAVDHEPDVRPKGAFSMRGHVRRFGDDEQSHRHDRRRSIRPSSPGLSNVWIREERPTDDLLLTVAEEPIGAHVELRPRRLCSA